MTVETGPALAVFTYNRLEHTRRTIEKLQQNTIATEVPLFVFSDGPKNEQDRRQVEQLRQFLGTLAGFRSVSVWRARRIRDWQHRLLKVSVQYWNSTKVLLFSKMIF